MREAGGALRPGVRVVSVHCTCVVFDVEQPSDGPKAQATSDGHSTAKRSLQ